MAKKELTEQQKRFLEVLISEANGNINHAMKMAGFSEGYSRRQLTNALKEEIIEATPVSYTHLTLPTKRIV